MDTLNPDKLRCVGCGAEPHVHHAEDCKLAPYAGPTAMDEALASLAKYDNAMIAAPVRSDGGSSSYYNLPSGASELNDLIEAKNMSFARGNIFKACYRLGSKANVDAIYDINKIIYFAERMKRMLEKGQSL